MSRYTISFWGDGQTEHYKTGASDGMVVVKGVQYDSLGHLVQTYRRSPIYKDVRLSYPVNAAATAALEAAHNEHGVGYELAAAVAVQDVLFKHASAKASAPRPVPRPRSKGTVSVAAKRTREPTPEEAAREAKLLALRKALLLETQIQSGAEHMKAAITHTLTSTKSTRRAEKKIQSRIDKVATEIATAGDKINGQWRP